MKIATLLSILTCTVLLTACGPSLEDAQKLGFESVEQMKLLQKAGFKNMNEFKALGFTDLAQMEEYQKAGFKSKKDFDEFGYKDLVQMGEYQKAGFQNMKEFIELGFADIEEFNSMKSNGFNSKSEYEKSKKKNEELGIDLSKRNNIPYPFCTGEVTKEWNDCIAVKDLNNGSVFTGEFHNGKAIGRAEYAFSNGGKYIGDVDGVPNGRGKIINPDKSTFEGEFKDGEENGFGISRDSQGKEIWAGKWVMGARDLLSKRETINQAMSIEQIASCSAAYAVVSKYSDKFQNHQIEINKAKQNLINLGHGAIVQDIYNVSFHQASRSAQYGISLLESCNQRIDKISANSQQ